MPNPTDNSSARDQLQELNAALASGTFKQVRAMLNTLRHVDVARLIESSTPKNRQLLWRLIDVENEGEVLQALNDDISNQFLSAMDAEEIVALTEGLETDDIADLLQQLPDQIIAEVLRAMDVQDRQRLETILTYPEDTAGGLMNTDTITVRPSHTLDVVLRYLRRHDEIPRMTDNLIVVDRQDTFLGLLQLRKILVSDPTTTVRDIMLTDVEAIPASMPDSEVASLF